MDSGSSLAQAIDFELLEPTLAKDVASALSAAIEAGVVFRRGETPLQVFRELLGEAIRDIEHHPRGELFQRFLRRGPYWDAGPIPPSEAEKCLPDAEVGAAITFIYSFMVNTFQGCLAEILALPACLEIVGDLQTRSEVPPQVRIYAGESVLVPRASGRGRVKGADLHILEEIETGRGPGIRVWGVIEVKSYPRSSRRLVSQLSDHLRAAARGLHVQGVRCGPEGIEFAATQVEVAAVPATWRLPRTFRFVEEDGRSLIRVDPGTPPTEGPATKSLGNHSWHITLRWSREALAAAAYELTFWYMAKVGEVVYAGGLPEGWGQMTPAEAGRNAARMMLYYAILRAQSREDEQSAIALYNTYGFGYALGTSFKNPSGARTMLWPEDLREILEHGKTKHGCRLRPSRARARS